MSAMPKVENAMVEEELNLLACVQKLKLASRSKPVKIYRDDESANPFARKTNRLKSPSTTSLFGPTCMCRKKRPQNKRIPLKAKNRLLREPLIVVTPCTHVSDGDVKDAKLFGAECGSAQQDFRSIIAGCEQLSLKSADGEPSSPTDYSEPTFRALRIPAQRPGKPVTSSCSQQAMTRLCVNPPCDITIDELASYFETLVHIPKKMSSMAEMMYI